jgi:fibronectin-binding autotransporter adhesin
MQGFFVHVTDGTYPVSTTFGLTDSVSVTDQTHGFLKGDMYDLPLVRITASYNDHQDSPDPFVIYLNEKASVEFDSQFDALKMYNSDLNVPNIYSVTPGGVKLSINALPYTSEADFSVPVGLKVSRNGIVVFKLRDLQGNLSDMRVFIHDTVTGEEKELNHDSNYSTNLTPGEYLGRFFLNLYHSTTNLPEDKLPVSEIFSVYSAHRILKTEINKLLGSRGTLIITNMLGQKVFETEIYETGYFELSPGLMDGIYIVAFSTGKIRSLKKLLMKN